MPVEQDCSRQAGQNHEEGEEDSGVRCSEVNPLHTQYCDHEHCLGRSDRLGPPIKAKVSRKAVGLSYNPSSDSEETTEQLPVSPFFTKRLTELSECLAGADEEGEENREKAYGLGKLLPTLKARMGWYKVPRQSFDYAPASLDSILFERGVKEPDSVKVDSATLIRMEREARTLELISSFGDMAGASYKRPWTPRTSSRGRETRSRPSWT